MDYLLAILDKLPVIRENMKAILFLAFTGLVVGFTGFPLWIAYRNEKQILSYILSTNTGKPVGPSFSADQLVAIQNTLTVLVVQNEGVHRAIFGILENNNRIIVSEYYNPVDGPLPLGFQTVYLPSQSYHAMLEAIRSRRCYTLSIPPDGPSYFRDEVLLANSTFYMSCPSRGDWFVALYSNHESPHIIPELERAIRDLESVGL